MGLPMGDDCHKRLSQPRFISWNDENTQYFNHNAQPYSLLSPEKTYHSIKKSYQKTESGSHPNNPFQWCTAQINKSNAFIEGKRHKYLVKLVRYCNIKGIPEADTLSGCLSFLKDVTEPEQKKIMSIVKNIYSKQSGSFNSIPFT
jgi:hypothetical protein